MNMLKVILVNLIFFGMTETQLESSKEYELINYLVCEKDDSVFIDERFISWNEVGYHSYNEINVINMKLDREFYEDHKQQIDQIINPTIQQKVEPDFIKCKVNLNRTISFSPKKTIYSYSYPMLMRGEDQKLYGVIIERRTFEIDNYSKIKVFKKLKDSWELVYENLISFS